jgi:PAS domain S-box-containing protein
MLMTGTGDSQWVALRGVIRRQNAETNQGIILTLATGDGLMRLYLPKGQPQPGTTDFVDAAVEVHGVCRAVFNERRQLESVQLAVPSWDQVQITESAPPEPFDLPPQPVNELFQFHPGNSGLHRVRLQGCSLLRQDDGSFFLQDGAGGICVQPLAPRTIPTGKAVTVVGFPSLAGGLPVLQDSLVKVLGDAKLPSATELNPSTALDPALYGTLVCLQGQFLGLGRRNRAEILTVGFGPMTVNVLPENGREGTSLSTLTPGSIVRVTGVYAARLDDDHELRSFQVLMRSPEDLQVVSRPGWWSARHALWVFGGLGAVLVLAVGWIGLLRKRVRQQTRELRSEVAERKRAEVILQRAYDYTRNLIEASLDPLVTIGPDGKITGVNKATERATGISRAELLGTDFSDYFTEPGKARTACEQAFQEGTVRDYSLRLRHRDGQIMPVLYNATVFKDEGGKVLGVFAAARDVTEIERHEAIQSARLRLMVYAQTHSVTELLRTALDEAEILTGSQIGFCHFLENDQKTLFPRACSSNTLKNMCMAQGAGPHCPVDQAGVWADCIRERRPVMHNDYAALAHRKGLPAGHAPVVRELVVPVLRGEDIKAAFGVGNKATNYNEDDVTALSRLADLAWDIAARQQAEEAVVESEARFSAIFHSSPVAISLSQVPDGRFVDVNDAFLDLFNLARSEVIGHTSFELNLWHVAEERDGFIKLLQEKLVHQAETTLRRKSGELCDVLISGQLVQVRDQSYLLGIVVDVSERKRLEERLRQSQKMESIGLLAGGMAHEFNNILAAMLMNLDLARMSSGGSEIHDHLQEMEALCSRSADLIKQLLAFSRQSVMQLQVMDLRAAVSRQCKMLARLLGEKAALHFSSADDPTWVKADQAMVEQVLLNLCLNARDAMKDGGIIRLHLEDAELGSVQAAALEGARPGRYACLSVADTGCGMDERTLKRLFEPFFTTKEVGRGSGLGLATVRGIIQQMHGWVEVESCVGKGSTFRIYFPAVAQPPATPTASAKHASVRGHGTILVVEDEPTLRKLARKILDRLGYVVLEASNGDEALEVWEAHRSEIDLIFTDMVMPGSVTGLQLVQKGLADKPNVKAIITSGYNTDQKDLAQIGEGSIVYLSKPYDVVTLTSVIQRCLERT